MAIIDCAVSVLKEIKQKELDGNPLVTTYDNFVSDLNVNWQHEGLTDSDRYYCEIKSHVLDIYSVLRNTGLIYAQVNSSNADAIKGTVSYKITISSEGDMFLEIAKDKQLWEFLRKKFDGVAFDHEVVTYIIDLWKNGLMIRVPGGISIRPYYTLTDEEKTSFLKIATVLPKENVKPKRKLFWFKSKDKTENNYSDDLDDLRYLLNTILFKSLEYGTSKFVFPDVKVMKKTEHCNPPTYTTLGRQLYDLNDCGFITCNEEGYIIGITAKGIQFLCNASDNDVWEQAKKVAHYWPLKSFIMKLSALTYEKCLTKKGNKKHKEIVASWFGKWLDAEMVIRDNPYLLNVEYLTPKQQKIFNAW